MGGASGMVVAARSLRLVSIGAGVARCEGGGGAVLQMAAWLASRAVLPAPVAAKQVRALGSPAMEGRMAAPAEKIDYVSQAR